MHLGPAEGVSRDHPGVSKGRLTSPKTVQVEVAEQHRQVTPNGGTKGLTQRLSLRSKPNFITTARQGEPSQGSESAHMDLGVRPNNT